MHKVCACRGDSLNSFENIKIDKTAQKVKQEEIKLLKVLFSILQLINLLVIVYFIINVFQQQYKLTKTMTSFTLLYSEEG